MSDPKTPKKPYTIITQEDVTNSAYGTEITMNSRNYLNLNPRVTDSLKSLTPGTFEFVEVGYIDPEGAEIAVAPTNSDNPAKVQLHYSANQRSSRFSMSRLVAKYPALRVERGYCRKFTFTVRTESGTSFLVLDAKGSKVVPVEKKRKSPGSNKAADAQKQQAAGDDKNPQ